MQDLGIFLDPDYLFHGKKVKSGENLLKCFWYRSHCFHLIKTRKSQWNIWMLFQLKKTINLRSMQFINQTALSLEMKFSQWLKDRLKSIIKDGMNVSHKNSWSHFISQPEIIIVEKHYITTITSSTKSSSNP